MEKLTKFPESIAKEVSPFEICILILRRVSQSTFKLTGNAESATLAERFNDYAQYVSPAEFSFFRTLNNSRTQLFAG